MEEERILDEFKKVKLQLKEKSHVMDEEEFDATRETCMVLGGKLMETRAKQNRCYSDNEDLEMVINREIMAIRSLLVLIIQFLFIINLDLRTKISKRWIWSK